MSLSKIQKKKFSVRLCDEYYLHILLNIIMLSGIIFLFIVLPKSHIFVHLDILYVILTNITMITLLPLNYVDYYRLIFLFNI